MHKRHTSGVFTSYPHDCGWSSWGVPVQFADGKSMRVRFRHPVSGVYAGLKLSQYAPGVVYEVPDDVGDRLRMMGAELAGRDSGDGEPLLTDEQLTGGVTVFQADAADRQPRKRIQARRKRR